MTAKLVHADRVKETTTTSGTGTYTLLGPVAGFQGFVAGIGTTNRCFYCCDDGTNWEVGEGVVTDAASDTLSRTTILASSNANSAVNWAAGITKNIYCVLPATVVNGAVSTNGSRLGDSYQNNNQGLEGCMIIGITNSLGTAAAVSSSSIVGYLNAVNASNSMAVGDTNSITGSGSSFAAGSTNVVSGQYAASFGTGTASATRSFSSGYGANCYLPTGRALASVPGAVNGDRQMIEGVFTCATTNATQTHLNCGPGPIFSSVYTRYSRTYLVDGQILARQYGGSSGAIGDAKAWQVQWLFDINSSGTMTVIGTLQKTVIANTTDAATWDVALVDTDVKVTGQANKSIRWLAKYKLLEEY